MKKRDEISQPDSCWNKAKDDEVVFVLLARDPAAQAAIAAWMEKRIALGKNKPGDHQVAEAEACGGAMLLQRLELARTNKRR